MSPKGLFTRVGADLGEEQGWCSTLGRGVRGVTSVGSPYLQVKRTVGWQELPTGQRHLLDAHSQPGVSQWNRSLEDKYPVLHLPCLTLLVLLLTVNAGQATWHRAHRERAEAKEKHQAWPSVTACSGGPNSQRKGLQAQGFRCLPSAPSPHMQASCTTKPPVALEKLLLLFPRLVSP